MMSESTIALHQLVGYLDEVLQPHKFTENTINGIQIATTKPIARVATAVTASLEAIEKANELGVQALIVHHGLFRKNECRPLIDTFYKKVHLLMKHDIALLTYHLPLDADQTIGNNWKAARDLGLQDLKPFLEYVGVNIGVIGSMPPTPFDAFKLKVEEYYGNKSTAVKVKDPIRSVAIVSGGADKEITYAVQVGADCYITGRYDEPLWDTAHEEGISFLGLGHYATETVGVKAIAELVVKQFGIPATFIKTDNPF